MRLMVGAYLNLLFYRHATSAGLLLTLKVVPTVLSHRLTDAWTAATSSIDQRIKQKGGVSCVPCEKS
jgi:hypothetical protein